MQTIQIIGYLGKDAQIRELGNSGQKILTFNVGVTRQYKDGKSKTTWYYCSRFYREGSELAKLLTKGRKVLVRGELSLSVYAPNSSEPQAEPRIMYAKIEKFLNGKKADGDQEQPTSESTPSQENLPDLEQLEAEMLRELSQEYNDSTDDLPF